MSNNKLQLKEKEQLTGPLKSTHKAAVRAMALLLIFVGKLLLRVKTYEELEKWIDNAEERFDDLEKQFPDLPQIGEQQQKTDDTNLINNY